MSRGRTPPNPNVRNIPDPFGGVKIGRASSPWCDVGCRGDRAKKKAAVRPPFFIITIAD
jgi:hypothetical protein